jgi:hypothetical protein
VSDWTRAGLRWGAAIAAERWSGTDRALSLSVSAQQRLADDRAFVEARAGTWRGNPRTWTLGLEAEWRTTLRNEGDVWIGRGGIETVGADAPLALWPGAGTGQGRDVLLRAHPLLVDGVISGGAFGRRLFHAGVEWRRWLQPGVKAVRLAPAVFVDAAHSARGLESSNRRPHVDVGGGLRVSVPGAGVVRIDLARGLRDGAMALSFGWTR